MAEKGRSEREESFDLQEEREKMGRGRRPFGVVLIDN